MVGAHRTRRDRRAATSTVAAIAARAVLVVGSLVSIPLAIGYLGVDRYGVFVALSSLTSIFVFADLGLGNGLLNVVGDAHGRDEREAARRAVSSALFMLIGVAAVLAAAFLAAYPRIDWASVFRVSTSLGDEVAPTAAVLFAAFLVALPLGIVERVRLAYQEGFLNSLAAMAGSLLALGALIAAIALRASLPLLVLAITAPPVVALAFNGYRLFRKDRPWLLPSFRLANRATVTKLARLGFLFFVLQLAVAVAYRSDVLVAATVLGTDAAATYAVTLQVFLLVPALVAAYLAQLWPAYTEALARKDALWIRRTLRRSIGIAVGASAVASAVLLVVGASLIRTWTGGAIDPPIALLVGAALWAVLNAGFTAIAMLLNAASVVKFQVVVASTMAIASITLSIVFANVFGVSGIIWGTVVAYVVFAAIPTSVYLPRVMRRINDLDHSAIPDSSHA